MRPYRPPAPSSSSPSPAISTAFAVAAALANPYSPYPSHYTQPYQRQSTTLDGYTISSAYTPSMNSSSVSSGGNRIIEPKRSQQTFNPQSSASWYQPGNNKCSYPGCNFSGPHKALEIHKMDRHLIYPPRWEKRKQKSDWDADPSLKGLVRYSVSAVLYLHLIQKSNTHSGHYVGTRLSRSCGRVDCRA